MICMFVKSIADTAIVEKTVQKGDTITLPCDLGPDALKVEWQRNYIHQNQTKSSIITSYYTPLRFSIIVNSTAKSADLQIENLTEQDLGHYFCTGIKDTATAPVSGTIYKVSFQGK